MMRTVVVFTIAWVGHARLFGSRSAFASEFQALMHDVPTPPEAFENARTSFLNWLHGAKTNHTRANPRDGYLDTEPSQPRNIAPEGDPSGDSKGWGAKGEAATRETSPKGEMPEQFSILDFLFGPVGSCHPWTGYCTFGAVLSGCLMAWTFKNLKVVSDVYFVPSTIALAKRLGIKPDVAGATLLAFGSSAPEFCTNVVASFFITNECGVGDIVGSAIHNILLIVGVSGLCAAKTLNLWWYPLSRDSLFFLIAIFELLFFLWDEYLRVWEAATMVMTYFVYCGWMFWNEKLYDKLCKLFKVVEEPPEEGDDDDEEGEGIFYYDPVEMLWRNTMPKPTDKCWACFLFALSHIAWNSYLMVDAATRFGEVLGIPTLFMGLVFLAAGTSIPDAFASMGAARKGEGDMAVSNALGSNIFDILMGLGLPWLGSLMVGKPIVFLGVSRLLYWVVALLGVLAAFVSVVVAGKWKLGRNVGLALVLLYFCYVIWASFKAVVSEQVF